jgi:hypothetical protein
MSFLRPLCLLILTGLVSQLSACAVASVAGSVAGAAISVGGAVVSTGVEVTGKVVGATIDAASSSKADK